MGSCKTQHRLESIGIPNSLNSIALQADYVTVVEDRPVHKISYPSYIWPTQLSHGLFATAKLLVCFVAVK